MTSSFYNDRRARTTGARRQARRCSLLLLAGLLAAGAGAAAAHAAVPNTDPCNEVADCTVQLEPWTVVPAGEGPSEPGSTSVTAICSDRVPSLGFAADVGSGFDGSVYLDVMLQAYYAQYMRIFTALNPSDQPVSFQPKLGCLEPQAATARSSAQESPLRARTIEVAPRQRSRHRIACRSGERLVGRGAAVQFLTRRQPSRRELRQVHVQARPVARGIAVALRVGPSVGDHERVRLRIHAHCLA